MIKRTIEGCVVKHSEVKQEEEPLVPTRTDDERCADDGQCLNDVSPASGFDTLLLVDVTYSHLGAHIGCLAVDQQRIHYSV